MGFLLAQHGPITLEADDDNFVIHASYGTGQRTKQAVDTKLRDVIEVGGRAMVVTSISEEGGVEIQAIDDEAVTQVLSLSAVVSVPGSEVRINHPLGDYWRGTEHPMFMNSDLDELLDALRELKQYRRDNP